MNANATTTDDRRFEFGKNWQRFLDCIDDKRLATAKQSIQQFMQIDSLAGKTFIDVGCGSGLFSWAAFALGADRIVSFDLDRFSVACCEELRRRSGEPEHWQVTQGSVLDPKFLKTLGTFDVVYSWGVLHHTGQMWQAIENAMGLMNPTATFYIAIYNKKRGYRGSKYWHRKKKFYCSLPRVGQKIIVGLHVAYFAQSKLFRFKSPWRSIREYQSKRGMNWYTDLIDWLGGYPYEYANVEELFKFVRGQDPTCQLTNLIQGDGLGCHQLLFERCEKS